MRKPIEKISTRTLKKWERCLQEINALSSGPVFSNVNYALHTILAELNRRQPVGNTRRAR